mmetsp:Transcript_35772/g.93588  ORF Transcript_35772/g.93588 Transcript_35772/m.93588 type:complete len:222 (+) Transcript_35772:682-1347(+)
MAHTCRAFLSTLQRNSKVISKPLWPRPSPEGMLSRCSLPSQAMPLMVSRLPRRGLPRQEALPRRHGATIEKTTTTVAAMMTVIATIVVTESGAESETIAATATGAETGTITMGDGGTIAEMTTTGTAAATVAAEMMTTTAVAAIAIVTAVEITTMTTEIATAETIATNDDAARSARRSTTVRSVVSGLLCGGSSLTIAPRCRQSAALVGKSCSSPTSSTLF